MEAYKSGRPSREARGYLPYSFSYSSTDVSDSLSLSWSLPIEVPFDVTLEGITDLLKGVVGYVSPSLLNMPESLLWKLRKALAKKSSCSYIQVTRLGGGEMMLVNLSNLLKPIAGILCDLLDRNALKGVETRFYQFTSGPIGLEISIYLGD